MKKQIKLKRLNLNTILPKYQTQGAAAFDIHTVEPVVWRQCSLANLNKEIDVVSGLNTDFDTNIPVFTATVKSGFAIELPEDMAMLIYPRSGWGFKHNISLANGTGVIDSDFRGEVLIKLIAIAPDELPKIEVGTRIAQAIITKIERPELCFVDNLSDTERGIGGFGHTGN